MIYGNSGIARKRSERNKDNQSLSVLNNAFFTQNDRKDFSTGGNPVSLTANNPKGPVNDTLYASGNSYRALIAKSSKKKMRPKTSKPSNSKSHTI